MAPVYKFRSPAGVISDITTYFRLYKLDVATNAEEGTVAQSSIQADDPTGAFDIVGHRIFEVLEDTATGSNTQIYVGYTAGRRISRGDYHRTSAGRVWDIDLVDINSVLSRRVMTGTDANRPAETDVARVQWLMTTNEAAIIVDSLYLNTSGGIAMDAADYRGQKFNQVLDDCAQASGKNHFVWSRHETGNFSLWYDFATSTNYTSPLRLSNVSTDVDSVLTFALSNDTELSRSPDRVNSGAYLPFDGGAVYSQDVAIANSFARRDAVMPSENVKTSAKATARATRYLTEMSTEEDVITTTVQLPAAKVNFLMQGMRVQLRASHLPGYESFSWGRVLNRSVQQVSEELYDVKLEISPSSSVAGDDILIAFITRSQTDTGIVPTDLSTNGWTKAFWSGNFADPAQSAGPGGAVAMGIWYRRVVPGESATVLQVGGANPGTNAAWVFQTTGALLAGIATSNANDSVTWVGNPTASTVASASAAVASVWFGGFSLQKVNYGQVTLITSTNGTNLIDANASNVSGGVCAVTADSAQPRTWIGHRSGTGVLTIGGNLTCSGASPDYNLFGRGRGGLLLPLATGATFAVSQQGFHSTAGADIIVTLPAAP